VETNVVNFWRILTNIQVFLMKCEINIQIHHVQVSSVKKVVVARETVPLQNVTLKQVQAI